MSLDLPGAGLLPVAPAANAVAPANPDLIWRHTSTGANAVWELNGTSIVSGQGLLAVADLDWVIGGFADFTGDGRTDILWRNAASGSNAIWEMDQNTVRAGLGLPSVADPAWIVGGVGDMNEDGWPDIVWRNTTTGANTVWMMNATTIQSGESLLTVSDLDWKLRGVGDATGDGKADLVWRNTGTGANALWEMDGLTILSGQNIATVADLAWDIQGFGDLTGDGKDDLIWRNTATGSNAAWEMDHHTVVSGLTLLEVSDPGWTIAGVGNLYGPLPLTLGTSYLVGGYTNAPYSSSIVGASGGTGTYSYALSGGALPLGLSLNAASGAITGTPTVPGMSFFEITATSGGLSASVLHSITISNNAPGAFNLWAVNVASSIPSAAVRAQIDAALARWESVVIGDVGGVIIPGHLTCAGHGITANAFVDDVLVLIDITPIDGPSNTLGSAGACIVLTSPILRTVAGSLRLDSADLGGMSSGGLFWLIFHEIGHVMGIANSSWNGNGLMSGSGTSDPRFLGVTANGEYNALGGVGNVPIEADGGDGTAYGHWDEGEFDNEVMTGWSESGAESLSRVTIASLADIGWSVSYATADSYALPSCRPFCAAVPGLFPTEPQAVEVAPDWPVFEIDWPRR